jgi:uncharacterized protein
VTARRWAWLALAVALLLVGGRLAALVHAEYRWFLALDAVDAWQVRWTHEVLLRALAFAAAGLLAWTNLWSVRRSVVAIILPRRLGNLEIGEEVPARLVSRATVVAALLVALIAALPATAWERFALARAGGPFGESDPYVLADLGVWVFWFPFERAMHAWLSAVLGLLTVLVAALYAATPSLRWRRGTLRVSTWARRHLAVLAACLLVMVAWSFRLEAFALLLEGSGPGGAFGADDQRFGLPVLTILGYTTFAAAAVILWAGWSGQPRLAVAVLSIVLLLAPTLRWVVPGLVRLGSAAADELERERPFAAVRAGFTRRAFALDRIRPLPDSLTAGPGSAMTGVPVWDPPVLTRALSPTQRHGGLLGMPALEPGDEGAGPRLQSLAAPLPPMDGLETAEPWTIVRVRAAVADAAGQPVPVDSADRLPEREERLSDLVVWDGARGALVVEDGRAVAGAPLDEALVRLSAAWSAQDPRLLATRAPGARLLRRRDVRERVRALVPFFVHGTTVTPLLTADDVVWVLDLFAASSGFPLSRPLGTTDGTVRYLAPAATALVSARSGRVTIVPVPDPDPVLRAWMRLVPRTVGGVRQVPDELADRLPPPVTAVEWQAEAYAAVGARGEMLRRRDIPALDGSDTLATGRPVAPLWWPGLPAGAWVVPLVDATDRVDGLLVAVGGASRGIYWHPLAEPGPGWMALLDSLRSAVPADGPVVAGRVRVVPQRGGQAAYVQPFYAWPRDAAPSLASVAVRDAEGTRAARSLTAALGLPEPVGPVRGAVTDDALDLARARYEALRRALSRGDWAGFGAALEALGTALERPARR